MASSMILIRKLPPRIKQNKNASSFPSNYAYKSNLSCVVSIPSWFHNLPIEVLLNVFQYFSEAELVKCIFPVCRQWRYVASQPELWKKMYMDGENVPTYYICQKIRDLIYLESICLVRIAEPVVAIRQICRWKPNLKHLTLKNCPEISEVSMCNLIQCCKMLETLDLSGTEFEGHRFYEEVSGLKYFKSINLSKNSKLNVCNVLSIVLNCRKLEELKISTFTSMIHEQLRDEDASLIIRNLAPTLKSLTLDAGDLTNFSFKAIMNCKKLENLGLYRAVNFSADVFTTIWKHLPRLKTLKIRHSPHITGQNIVEFCMAGRSIMQQIILIDFSGCWKISDTGLEAIANCCDNLKSLSLKSCKNIFSLQNIRDKCVNLEKLNVAFCINLNIDTIIPLPQKLNILIIDKSDKFTGILKNTSKTALIIKVCLSEYNKQMERLICRKI